MFFKWSLNEFGFRGTVLLVSGLMMQNFIAAALLQPVEWHMKKEPIKDREEGNYTLLRARQVFNAIKLQVFLVRVPK